MFDKIKRLGTDTAMYGVSTILGRFLTFILTPLYANLLIPSELGIVATMYSYIAFLNVVYGYGMESAFFRYYSAPEIGDKKQNFTVPFASLVITSSVFSMLITLCSSGLSSFLGLPDSGQTIVRYTAIILLLDAVAIIPFALLRMEKKAKTFASIKLAGICVNVLSNILFLMYFRKGVEGIFLSNVLSSSLVLFMLIPAMVSHISGNWHQALYRELLRFALPYVPAGIAAMMIQVIDRPILEALTDKATVGIYQANYRLGIFMMLIVSTYDFAWRPFFLSHANDKDAKQMFARILTYYILFISVMFLMLSFFIEDLVKLPLFWGRSLLPETYWAGLTIVPVVLLAYMFLGISNNIVAGIYIEKRTKHLPTIAFLGAAVNVVANYALIPVMGLMGAALATLLSYLIMTIVMYVIVQTFYPVKYEIDRIIKIAISLLIVFLLFIFVPVDTFRWLWKIGLLALFCVTMYMLRFFNAAEITQLVSLFKRRNTADVVSTSPPSSDV